MNDIMLGRKLGKDCQLKYADLPMHRRLTRNKFADADQDAQFTCNRWLQKWERDKNYGITRKSPWAVAGQRDILYHPHGIFGPAHGYAPWQTLCVNNEDVMWFSGACGMHSSMSPATKFPLRHRFFAEYIYNIRDRADARDKYGNIIYPLSCHFVNLDAEQQHAKLRWPCLSESPTAFYESLLLVTAEAETMRHVREASLCSNPFYWSDDKSAFMMEQMGNATVHCGIGSAKSGDENIHVAKRIHIQKPLNLPVLNDGNYYLHDDVQRFEHFKQSMRDYTDNYQQVLLQIRAGYDCAHI
jgi:hypothetical protein